VTTGHSISSTVSMTLQLVTCGDNFNKKRQNYT